VTSRPRGNYSFNAEASRDLDIIEEASVEEEENVGWM
jgi:hypothetical protein